MDNEQTLLLLKPNITLNDETETALAFFKNISIVSKVIKTRKSMGFFKRFFTGSIFPHKGSHEAFCSSAPVVAAILTGTDVVNKAKKMAGDVDASVASPLTVRGYFYKKYPHSCGGRNFIHVSESVEHAEREIKMFFGIKE